MAIPTSRTSDAAQVAINNDLCSGCGLCIKVCKDFGLRLANEKAALSGKPLFGCIGCGHCMAICPTDAIKVHGRTIAPEQIFPLEPEKTAASFQQLTALLHRRRSLREFSDKPVEQALAEKILQAAQSAPSGLPPSDVNVLIIDGIEKNRLFAADFCTYLKSLHWLHYRWLPVLLRLFLGQKNSDLFKNFVKPALAAFTEKMDEGVNIVSYDAPLSMYFYASPYADPADPIIAATYAMLAAEALGLGSCMIGSIHPLIQHGRKARLFRQKYGIKNASREGIFVLFGYPEIKYSKGIKRTFASVDYLSVTTPGGIAEA